MQYNKEMEKKQKKPPDIHQSAGQSIESADFPAFSALCGDRPVSLTCVRLWGGPFHACTKRAGQRKKIDALHCATTTVEDPHRECKSSPK